MNIIRMLRDVSGIVSILICSLLIGCAESPQREPKISQNLVKAAHINVELGLAYLEKNEMSRAKNTLLQAKREAPKEPVVWYGMGYFLERTGDFRAAEEHYRFALELSPDVGPAFNNYGAFLCRHGRYQEALKAFEKAAADRHYLEPAVAYANAGFCALKIPNQRLANQYFQRALEKDPKIDVSTHDREWHER